ncbi:MAG: phospholipase D-like domain-containing protein, partial [Bacteroidales bacterium]
HSKIMMVDSLYSFIGSANLNSRSLSFDYECNLLIADAPTTHQLISLFNRDRDEHCYLLTPELWKQLPKWKKFKGWLFHFLTPFVDAPKRRQGIPGMIIIDRLYA